MKRLGTVSALVVGLLLLAGAAQSAESTRPPTNLKMVGDHWTPWDPPEAGPDAYIIQKDDTLWDLAGKWLGDPYLWPQVWDENRYILDSHWIYPGDPLVIPGKPTVVSETTDPGEELPDEPEVAEVTPGFTPKPATEPQPIRPAPLMPVAKPSDLYCSGYIDPEPGDAELWIAGNERGIDGVATADVVYLNHGRDWGLKAGDEYGIIRQTRDVLHPVTGDELGRFIARVGRVRVMLAHDTSATAVIEMACADIREGDVLVPWQDIPTPMMASRPEFDRYDITPSGGPAGRLVTLADNVPAAGEGMIVYTDLGVGSGINPGDVLTVYRANDELPRLQLGQAVVLTVESGTSTAKVIRSEREMYVGDQVEVTN